MNLVVARVRNLDVEIVEGHLKDRTTPDAIAMPSATLSNQEGDSIETGV
jgi:hypothetical protein